MSCISSAGCDCRIGWFQRLPFILLQTVARQMQLSRESARFRPIQSKRCTHLSDPSFDMLACFYRLELRRSVGCHKGWERLDHRGQVVMPKERNRVSVSDRAFQSLCKRQRLDDAMDCRRKQAIEETRCQVSHCEDTERWVSRVIIEEKQELAQPHH
jgi:hypothetical protein